MTRSTERRRFSRIPFTCGVQLSQDGQQWRAELLDISLKGLLVEETDGGQLQTGQVIDVQIDLADDASIRLQATLARRNNGQLGLLCESIDVDSISHLRQLIELNLGDPDACQRELAELLQGD